MPLKPEYYLHRADEIDAAANGVNDPTLKQAYAELSRAMRAMAEMLSRAGDPPDQLPHDNGNGNGMPKRH